MGRRKVKHKATALEVARTKEAISIAAGAASQKMRSTWYKRYFWKAFGSGVVVGALAVIAVVAIYFKHN
jgi:hypothetical protein